MYGAIIGAAAGLAGGVIGAVNSAKARKRQQAILDKRARQQEDVYNRDYYKDYTQTASAQSALNRAREIYQGGINSAKATQAVMGGTEESIAAAKQHANDAVAQTTAQIAVNGEAQQAHAQDRYSTQQDAISNAKAGIESDIATQNAKAGSEAIKAGVGLAQADAEADGNLIGNMFGFNEVKKKK